MLIAEKLTKRYSGKRLVEAVDGVDCQIQSGEFIAIVGRSGSGKSTLLAMLGGLCRPTHGSIQIENTDQWKLHANAHSDFRNRNIGFVFQFASLLPSLRALDNVALPALISGALSEKEAYTRARTLLEQVGLGTRYDFYPSEMSGGEQRRVAIARALINSPEVLLADEPTADLDEQTEAEILSLLIDVQRAHNLTLIVVTHNMEIAARADRILQMRAGKIVSDERGSTAFGERQIADCTATADDLARVKRLFDISPSGNEAEKVTLGEGFERFLGRLVLLTIPMIAIIWCVNYAVATVENHLIAEQTSAHQALEDLAMTGLRAEVKNVSLGAGNTYDVSVYLRNTNGGQPIYLLSPTMRGFVQIGSSWQEAPLKPVSDSPQRVLKITGEQILHYTFDPNVENYAQLLPYYMHVRFTNEMLISSSSQPKSDLIERADSYYVYLKPHDAFDDAIQKKMKFPGKPPVWIPMPPH